MPVKGREEVLPEIRSLALLFEAAVLNRPNMRALYDASTDESLTFQQLSDRSNQFARSLLQEMTSAGKKKTLKNADGDLVVALCIPPSLDLLVAIFGILKIGGAYLPFDVTFPSYRVDYIINDAKPAFLVIKGNPSATAHLNDNSSVRLLSFEDISKTIESFDPSPLTQEESSSENTVAILYTSGSTGVPKGVRVPAMATLNRLNWQWKTFPYASEEICCFKTALTFVDSISEIFGPLLTGHSLVIIPKVMTIEVDRLVQVLEREKVGRLTLVPTLLRSLLLLCSTQEESPLQQLRLWICSGEELPSDLLMSFFKIFDKGQTICNFYGSTEVLGDVTYVQFRNASDVQSKLLDKKVPIGLPVFNTQIYLVDSSLQEETEEGGIGELCVAGKNVASGYVGMPNAEKFIMNPFRTSPCEYSVLYRTGDFALHCNGQLYYAGRTDSQIKIRGHRIDLSEVEVAIRLVEGVQDCHVLCYKPGEINQALLGFYTGSEIAHATMKLKLFSLLPVYMVPQCIRLEELPLLVNGKVDRQALIKIYEKQNIDAEKVIKFDVSICEKSKTAMAEVLLKVVARVLGSSAPPSLSLDQNFFEIGGNSVNVVLVITSLSDVGLSIGIPEFLSGQNFLEILQNLRSAAPAQICSLSSDANDVLKKYRCLPLVDDMKKAVISMASKSFSEKGDYEQFANITYEELEYTIERMWSTFLKEDLSFVVCPEGTEEIVAVALNDDWYRMPELHFNSELLKHMFDCFAFCESSVSSMLPSGIGKLFHSELMATHEYLPPSENVNLVIFMEKENISLAKRKGFEATITTNTSKTTQYVCEDVLNYKPLMSVPINQYFKDGKNPFEYAPDSLYITTSAYFFDK